MSTFFALERRSLLLHPPSQSESVRAVWRVTGFVGRVALLAAHVRMGCLPHLDTDTQHKQMTLLALS